VSVDALFCLLRLMFGTVIVLFFCTSVLYVCTVSARRLWYKEVLGIRISMFLGLPYPDPFVRGIGPDPLTFKSEDNVPVGKLEEENMEKNNCFCILTITEVRSRMRSWIWIRIY
jgi:hypothetical protein